MRDTSNRPAAPMSREQTDFDIPGGALRPLSAGPYSNDEPRCFMNSVSSDAFAPEDGIARREAPEVPSWHRRRERPPARRRSTRVAVSIVPLQHDPALEFALFVSGALLFVRDAAVPVRIEA